MLDIPSDFTEFDVEKWAYEYMMKYGALCDRKTEDQGRGLLSQFPPFPYSQFFSIVKTLVI